MSDLENPEILDFICKGLDNTNVYISKENRIARKIMIELIKAGRSEFLLLRDDEVSQWWNNIYSGVRESFEKYQEKVRLYNIKLEAYNKLSAAERKTLGIRKPTKPKGL
jgi:hypothetical protein